MVAGDSKAIKLLESASEKRISPLALRVILLPSERILMVLFNDVPLVLAHRTKAVSVVLPGVVNVASCPNAVLALFNYPRFMLPVPKYEY